MSELNALLRWIHIVAGIIWIGHLYFFNWVNGPMGAKLDGPTKKAVVPELMPRALFWFRWGAAWTWVSGILLLLTIFYHGRAATADGGVPGGGAFLMLAVTLLAPMLYDIIFKTELGKDIKQGATVCFVILVVIIVLYNYVGGFGFRGIAIHTGALLGTTMAFNVWMRIWPAQQKIIRATKDGTPPDAALVAMAGARSRHNTYMSVPLIWLMMNEHAAATALGNWMLVPVMILVGWAVTNQLYKKAGTVQGF